MLPNTFIAPYPKLVISGIGLHNSGTRDNEIALKLHNTLDK